MTFKVVVAGSRSIDDFWFVTRKLNNLLCNKEDVTIISGTATGPDKLGEDYAKVHGYKVERYPADWIKYGKSAGYIRNREMAKVADAVVCFYDGVSKGTQHMIDITKEEGKPLRVIPCWGWLKEHKEGYECSSKGDKRFSAFYAEMPDKETIEFCSSHQTTNRIFIIS